MAHTRKSRKPEESSFSLAQFWMQLKVSFDQFLLTGMRGGTEEFHQLSGSWVEQLSELAQQNNLHYVDAFPVSSEWLVNLDLFPDWVPQALFRQKLYLVAYAEPGSSGSPAMQETVVANWCRSTDHHVMAGTMSGLLNEEKLDKAIPPGLAAQLVLTDIPFGS